MINQSRKNKRAGFRIDDVLPVAISMLTPEQFASERNRPGKGIFETTMVRDLLKREMTEGNGKSGQISPRLGKILEGIDAKLNYLVSIEMMRDIRRRGLQEKPLNLSVTGARFKSRTVHAKGEHMKIAMMLPMLPPVSMDLLAEVQRCKQSSDGVYDVAVMFCFRCRDEENKITQYVYKRQREMIRIESEQLRANQ